MATTPLTQAGLTRDQLAQRRADIIHRHHNGESFTDIAKSLGITKQAVHTLYWKAIKDVPAKAVHEIRDELNAHLAGLVAHTNEIRARTHVKLAGGEVVLDKKTGEPLLDSGPELDAIREQRQLLDQIAKLNGANAPAVVTVNGQIRYEINGADMESLR